MTINWNPDGKVRTVRKNIVGNTVNGPQASLRTDYQYNPAGQRIRKVTRDKSAATINPVTGTSWSGPEGPYEPALRRNKVTYYVRDANEQVIAIYEEQVIGHDEGQIPGIAGTGDGDGDLIADWMDNAPGIPNPMQKDFDHDGLGDACDLCVTVANGPETEMMLWGAQFLCPPGGCQLLWDGFVGGRNLRLAEWPIYGTGAHGRFATAKPKNLARVAPQGLPGSVAETFTRILKEKEYELSDHLGNVRVTFSDVKQLVGAPNAPPYRVDLLTYANYYPFGMLQPQRSYPAPGAPAPGLGPGPGNSHYRYGYNGKEMDNEWYGDAGNGLSGVGNSYDYGFRIYNPRYARFLSVDPLTESYPMLTPYQFASNTPIQAIDLDGLEAVIPFGSAEAINAKTTIQLQMQEDIKKALFLYTIIKQNRIDNGPADIGEVPSKAQVSQDETKSVEAMVVESYRRKGLIPSREAEEFTLGVGIGVTTSVVATGEMALAYLQGPQGQINYIARHCQDPSVIWENFKNKINTPRGQGELVGIFVGSVVMGSAFSALRSPSTILSASRFTGFSATETAILHEARAILTSSEIRTLAAAHITGESAVVNIGGRIIQYEPNLSASGMTLFGENGFLLGRAAFSSEAELSQTVLHELYRLNTSVIGRSGVNINAAQVTTETNAAADFAKRAYEGAIKSN